MNAFQRAARIFLFIFIVSSVFFAASMLSGGFSIFNSSTIPPTSVAPTQSSGIPKPTEDPNQPDNQNQHQNPSIWNNTITVITTIFTSVASFVGFLFTTIIGWRKEQREFALAEIQRKQLEAELEKSKLEMEKLKQENSKRKPAAKKKK